VSASFRWAGGRAGFPISVIKDGVIDGMGAVGLQIQRAMRERLSMKGTGRPAGTFVMRKRKGEAKRVKINRTRSAPGEPPAAQTGRLRASWTIVPYSRLGIKEQDNGFVSMVDQGGKSILYTVGSNMPYARALEYGSPRTRLAERPYVRPVVFAVSKEVPNIMALWVKRRMGRVFK